MSKQDICTFCGSENIIYEARPTQYKFKGVSRTVSQAAEWCNDCGEGLINPADTVSIFEKEILEQQMLKDYYGENHDG